MCGIAGLLTPPGSRGDSEIPDRLERAVAAQIHRGPDDQGIYLAPGFGCGLANCRLAIRDLSPAGHMPMGTASGLIWITYNGEIYNVAELQEDLQRAGRVPKSRSDTEVILLGYELWGADVIARLRGIFALGILDLRPGHETLLLARDPLGVKPLYYIGSNGSF